VASPNDLVIGLPDLHPVANYQGTQYAHTDHASLSQLQVALVARALRETYGVAQPNIAPHLARFYATSLKHDLEMLLLAAHDALQEVLGARVVRTWRQPVEEHNLQDPPKRVVERLFRTRSAKKRSYKDTLHAQQVCVAFQRISEQSCSTRMSNRSVPSSNQCWIGSARGRALSLTERNSATSWSQAG